MRFVALQSIVCDRFADSVGLSAPARLAVSDGPRGLRHCWHRPPSPAALRLRIHPLVSFPPLQSLRSCSFRVSTRDASLGVSCPLRDLRRWSRHDETLFPILPRRRPQSSSLSRRFHPPPAVQAYFIPQPRPGFALQGFSLRRSRSASSASRAFLSVRDLVLRSRCRERARLRHAAFKAFLRGPVRCAHTSV